MLKLPFSSAPDEVLVRGVLEDRPREFELLVLRYRRKACALAGAIGVPPLSLKEIVQDSFLQAFEHLPHLLQHENFGLWFLNIVRNKSRRFVRESRLLYFRTLPDRERGNEAERFEQEEFNELP